MPFELTTNMVGLILDICGAWLLAQGLVLNRDRHLGEVASPYWDLNPKLLRELVTNAYDARFGVGFLIFGFLLQFDGSLGRRGESVAWISLALAVTAFLVWLLRRSYSVSERSERILTSQKKAIEAAA